MDWGFWLFIWLVCGAIAAAIGQRKNLSVGGSFALGFFLSVIGIVIVICQRPGLPPAPAGMRSVKCTRCNAVQNIGATQTSFRCWQCKLVHGDAAQCLPPAPEDAREWLDRVKSPSAADGPTTTVTCFKCQHRQKVPRSAEVFTCEQCGARLKRKAERS
jgi:ribosomal protein S27E